MEESLILLKVKNIEVILCFLWTDDQKILSKTSELENGRMIHL